MSRLVEGYTRTVIAGTGVAEWETENAVNQEIMRRYRRGLGFTHRSGLTTAEKITGLESYDAAASQGHADRWLLQHGVHAKDIRTWRNTLGTPARQAAFTAQLETARSTWSRVGISMARFSSAQP